MKSKQRAMGDSILAFSAGPEGPGRQIFPSNLPNMS